MCFFHDSLSFLPDASFGLRVLSVPVPVCVCLSVCKCVSTLSYPRDNFGHIQTRITKLGAEAQTPWLRFLIFLGLIGLDFHGQISLKIQNFINAWLLQQITGGTNIYMYMLHFHSQCGEVKQKGIVYRQTCLVGTARDQVAAGALAHVWTFVTITFTYANQCQVSLYIAEVIFLRIRIQHYSLVTSSTVSLPLKQRAGMMLALSSPIAAFQVVVIGQRKCPQQR